MTKKTSPKVDEFRVGWREWASLPELNISAIKVKIDTGAKTSALHAFELENFTKKGDDYVRFQVHPLQKNNTIIRYCEARILEQRTVKSSNGQKEVRFTILTPIRMGQKEWDIELTLTNRDLMSYRMLLGREAMEALTVKPSSSFLQGKLKNKQAIGKYHIGGQHE